MIHLKNNGYSPKQSPELVRRARELCSDIDASIRVARVANKFVELDVSINPSNLDMLIKKLISIGELDNSRHVFEEKIEKEEGLKDGIFYFNNERFWESHESLEGVWKQCYGKEKELVQGIILLAVAFAHRQKDEKNVGVGMLDRALEKLGESPAVYGGIDIDRIRNKIKEMQKTKDLVLFEI